MYRDVLRKQFPDLDPVVDDLFLLEPHQVAAIPDRAPPDALAAVLRAEPRLYRYLCARHPPIEAFLSALVCTDADPDTDLATHEDVLLWELADWIVFQRAPGMYDRTLVSAWDLDALQEALPLRDKVIADVGAGTGQVTFKVAPLARTVWAVEPVAALRTFIRTKAADLGLDNVFVVDGTLAAVPLPDRTLDCLLTQRAIGWDLPSELSEIARVVRPGGVALHLTGLPLPADDHPLHAGLVTGGYTHSVYQDGDTRCASYHQRF